MLGLRDKEKWKANIVINMHGWNCTHYVNIYRCVWFIGNNFVKSGVCNLNSEVTLLCKVCGPLESDACETPPKNQNDYRQRNWDTSMSGGEAVTERVESGLYRKSCNDSDRGSRTQCGIDRDRQWKAKTLGMGVVGVTSGRRIKRLIMIAGHRQWWWTKVWSNNRMC